VPCTPSLSPAGLASHPGVAPATPRGCAPGSLPDASRRRAGVTHDQVEAMTTGDRVAVLEDGLLQQVDTPLNLYDRPKNG
jgi:hypothetical protein